MTEVTVFDVQMDSTYLFLLAHLFMIIKIDSKIFLRQEDMEAREGKKLKTFVHSYIVKEARGIDLLIVNDFIFTHENRPSDDSNEQLRKYNR
jgi:hypothetical protein